MANKTFHALNNEDVIYLICYCLTPDIDGRSLLESKPRERARSLARLARVRKNFNIPASRTLWRRLRDMRPLLHLFSGLEVEAASDDDHDDDPGELDVSSKLVLHWFRVSPVPLSHMLLDLHGRYRASRMGKVLHVCSICSSCRVHFPTDGIGPGPHPLCNLVTIGTLVLRESPLTPSPRTRLGSVFPEMHRDLSFPVTHYHAAQDRLFRDP